MHVVFGVFWTTMVENDNPNPDPKHPANDNALQSGAE